jgi:1-deoxy-D-xylulose-5-phosphate reductoisomerase
MTVQSLTILGATGSVGENTLEVVALHPDRYRIFALSANSRIDRLAALSLRFQPVYAVVPQAVAAAELTKALRQAGCATEVLCGAEALEFVAASDAVDTVMAAIVGAAGLRPALAAARRGKRILLANKEALVTAGRIFIDACVAGGATVLPIDSEHNAVFQCLTPTPAATGVPQVPAGVTRVVLTASGGPFRNRSLDEMHHVTPEQACAHPNWSMGRKISVDSATMMNKGLELIEAHFLFGLPGAMLDVLVHPQSVIHSLVEYADGSLLAQLSNPDMRTPIAHALAFPDRIASGVAPLDLARLGRLDFEEPDTRRFPCLRLAHEALRGGGAAPCVLNAANEVVVQAFLSGEIRFTDIAIVNEQVLQSLGGNPAAGNVEEATAMDIESRELARHHLLRCAA